MSDALRVALLGCGVVGSQVVRLLHEQADDLAARVGVPLELAGVAVRRPGKHTDIAPDLLTTDAAALVARDDIDLVVEVGHSRVPVYHDSIDEIVGILYAKDLLPYLKHDAGPRPALRKLLRPPVLVPESMTVDDLLHEFQRRKVHIAIVLDEYGGTAGLVTIEDLLEEIVGEIQDEYDVEEAMIEEVSDSEAVFDARVSIRDVNDTLDLEIDDEDFDTLGGLLYHELGKVPNVGDEVRVDVELHLARQQRRLGRRAGQHLVADPADVDDDRLVVLAPQLTAQERDHARRPIPFRGTRRA